MNKKKAFTVIELMVVIAIIGIIASIILVSLKEVRERATTAAGLNFAAQIHHALGAYSIGIWDFENNLNDSSGHGNDGTWEDTGGPAPVGNFKCASIDKENTPSGKGCSLEFNGVDDYVNCGSKDILDDLTAFTYTAWIKPSRVDLSYQSITNKGSWNQWFLLFNDRLRGFTSCSVTNADSYSVIGLLQTNNWYFVTMTFNNSGDRIIHLYSNGKEVSYDRQIACSGSLSLSYGSRNQEIGKDFASSYYFNGLIDDVHIYEEALNLAQVKKLYVEGASKHGLLAEE